jgi:hypothetical protein
MTHFNHPQRIPLQNTSGWDFTDSVSSLQIAEMISKSSICPPAYKNKPYDIIVAIQFGRSIGLAWGYSLLNIAMINGRPTLWGDAMLALCKQSPDFEYCDEVFDEQSMTALCEVKRKGEKAQVRQFSKEDAVRAHLWGKVGHSGNPTPWVLYPQRMLQMRARSWALRDMFPHVLQGLGCAEEVQDYCLQEEASKPQLSLVKNSNVVSVAETLKAKLQARKDEMTPETKAALMEMVERHGVEAATIQKWLQKAQVQEISQLTEAQAKAVMEMLMRKEKEIKIL